MHAPWMYRGERAPSRPASCTVRFNRRSARPYLLGINCPPVHLNSRLMFDAYARALFTDATRVLEIGPDNVPSTFSLTTPHAEWRTADIAYNHAVDFRMNDPYVLPLGPDRFDIVFSAQVLEHVARPW